MRSRNLIRLIISAALLYACTDDSYRGYEVNFAEYDPPMDVNIAVGDPTKGTGPKDKYSSLNGREVFVWAMSRDSLADWTIRRTTDSLTCLVDGYPAVLDSNDNVARWKDGRRFFYPCKEFSTYKFDFFAVYLDGADTTQYRFPDKVELHTKIDGSQDIMISKARLPIKEADNTPKDYAFSYLSAVDGDYPIFTMNHALVRIDLQVRPGITRGFSRQVVISEATLSSREDAIITVASKNAEGVAVTFPENGSYKDMLLTMDDGSKFVEDTLKTIMGDPNDEETISKQLEMTHKIGSSFFVSSEEQYTLVTTLHELGHADGYVERDPVDNLIRLASREAFLPGNHYVITMTIYGEFMMVIEVTMEGWENSGSFYRDPDAESEFEDLYIVVPGTINIQPGETTTINPLINVWDGYGYAPVQIPGVNYEFRSQDTSIVEVDAATGEVRAIAAGSTRVEVSATLFTSAGELQGYGSASTEIIVN